MRADTPAVAIFAVHLPYSFLETSDLCTVIFIANIHAAAVIGSRLSVEGAARCFDINLRIVLYLDLCLQEEYSPTLP
jgi:hypothetical protein